MGPPLFCGRLPKAGDIPSRQPRKIMIDKNGNLWYP